MDLNEYQEQARSTAIYDDKYKIIYPALGLGGESGEVLEKVKKLIRDSNDEVTSEFRVALTAEMGDVLWYLASLAADIGVDLNEVAKCNLEKLASRVKRDVLHGDGDNR